MYNAGQADAKTSSLDVETAQGVNSVAKTIGTGTTETKPTSNTGQTGTTTATQSTGRSNAKLEAKLAKFDLNSEEREAAEEYAKTGKESAFSDAFDRDSIKRIMSAAEIITKFNAENGVDIQQSEGYNNREEIDYGGNNNLFNLLKQYIKDIQNKTGMKLSENQIKILKDVLRKYEYKQLTSEETAKHRMDFNKVKNNIILEWEKYTGQKWPTYSEDVISPYTGKIIRKAGDKYDAHHIIENSYGGNHEWWNIHPARFPNEHQLGIHASDAPASRLFK